MMLEPSLLNAKELLHYLSKGDVTPIPSRVVILDHALQLNQLPATAALSIRAGMKTAVIPKSDGDIAVAASLGMGGPAITMTLELLVAMGAQEIVHVGTAGALNNELQAGDTLVVNRAYDDDGTARHYGALDSDFLSGGLESWPQWLQGGGVDAKLASVWSTGAPFRETRSKVRSYSDRGAFAVEMEAAALIAVGAILNVKVTCLRIISDLLTEDGWQPFFKDPRVKKSRQKVIDLLMERPWP